jgi:hypothetical protein
VPARFASVSRSAAGEGGHAPMKRGLDRKTIGLMPAPDGDRVDVHVTVTDVPARFASVSRSAAGEGGHAPMKRGLDRKTIGLMPSGAANWAALGTLFLTGELRVLAGLVKLAPQPSHDVFGAWVEPGYPAIPLPKLDVVAVDELLGGLNRRFVVRAIKLDSPNEMAVAAKDINPVFTHLRHPCRRKFHIMRPGKF